MNARPLEYASLKTVIQQMDPNLRFKVCHCLPSIGKIDRVVPLKIKQLKFEPYKIIVNEIEYQLGTYREYGNHEVPAKHKEQNEQGGVAWDFDEYGFQVTDDLSTPGTISIEEVLLLWPQNGEQVGLVESQLTILEYIMSQKQSGDYKPLFANLNDPNFTLIAHFEKRPVYAIRKDVALPYRYKQTGTLPPYKKFVQLNIRNPTGRLFCHNYPEGLKLGQAQKQLTDSLFGHRSDPILVKNLVVDSHIIHLPVGIKLKIRELISKRDTVSVCKAFQTIIDSSSYPLKVATVSGNDFNHPIIKTAEELVISRGIMSGEIQKVLNLGNRRITVRNANFQVNEFIENVENILVSPREIGTVLRFGIYKLEMIARILGMLETRFKQARTGPRCVIVGMNDCRRQMVVYYEPTGHWNNCKPPFDLVMKVEKY